MKSVVDFLCHHFSFLLVRRIGYHWEEHLTGSTFKMFKRCLTTKHYTFGNLDGNATGTLSVSGMNMHFFVPFSVKKFSGALLVIKLFVRKSCFKTTKYVITKNIY
mmetsp:Transcript_3408/g.3446  ORF Transcript_3408/g.3446 Transcript_3408/m.3446 type:complete len:105 (+) Transcript_3408:809-1123(+)